MKARLLLLIVLLSPLSYAQTFDWETAVVQGNSQNPNSSVSQVINGQYYIGFYTPSFSPILLTTAGQGTSGLSVRNQQYEPSVRISVNESVGTTVKGLNIQSIKVFDLSNNQSWTFKSLDASRNVLNTATAIVNQNASVVTLNWTNVSLIEITKTNGSSANFGVDDVVFTPYTPPCTVTIPDANFKAYLVGNTAINTNGDTEIQCSEATAYTGGINCNNLSIADLTGIEAFTNIVSLRCDNNQLASLDVSSNTALTYLSFGINQITAINLSNNTALTELYASNNLLTSLDVSNNTSLAKILCHSNSLTYLNVANGNNSVIPTSDFWAAGNANLTCITVDNVAYSNANWTNIDSQTSFNTNCATLGINDYKLTNMVIYPNPVKNTLNIHTEKSLEKVEVYTMQGQKILETKQSTINMFNLLAGMYLLKVTTPEGKVLVKQFIKQ